MALLLLHWPVRQNESSSHEVGLHHHMWLVLLGRSSAIPRHQASSVITNPMLAAALAHFEPAIFDLLFPYFHQ